MEESKWSQIKDVFRKLDANDSITDDAKKLIEYMNELSKCAGQRNANLKWDKKERAKFLEPPEQFFLHMQKLNLHLLLLPM